MNHYLNIFFILLIAFVIYSLFKMNHVVEGYAFCGATECENCVCERTPYKEYCNSMYLDYGPAGLCKCRWNDEKGKCEGTKFYGDKDKVEYGSTAVDMLKQNGTIPTGF